jgi:hypothetical protein
MIRGEAMRITAAQKLAEIRMSMISLIRAPP